MPEGIKQSTINLVNDADAIDDTMVKNNVLYHHSYRKTLNRDKLQEFKKKSAKIQQLDLLIW